MDFEKQPFFKLGYIYSYNPIFIMKMNDKLIESVVKKVILEYGGVSNEIMNISYDIFNAIMEQHRQYRRVPIDDNALQFNGHTLYCKEFDLEFNVSNPIWKVCRGVSVRLFFYEPNTENYDMLENFMNKNKLYHMAFNDKTKVIKLSIAWSSDDKMDDYAKYEIISSINHEVKHAYQSSKKNGLGMPDEYFTAKDELNKKFGWNEEADTPSKQLVDYYVPWCYYKLNKAEVDAWLQELYISANKTKDIKTSSMYRTLVNTINDYKRLKEWYCTSETEPYYKEQNLKQYIENSIRRITEPRKYFELCDRNVGYLERKMRRVIGRWYEEQGITNGSFKKYANGEIKQSTPLMQAHIRSKNRNSTIRNIISDFFNRKKR